MCLILFFKYRKVSSLVQLETTDVFTTEDVFLKKKSSLIDADILF